MFLNHDVRDAKKGGISREQSKKQNMDLKSFRSCFLGIPW
jgi:hypothetical protein